MSQSMKVLLVAGICGLIAIFLGCFVATGSYYLLGFLACLLVVGISILVPGYSFLLAFSLLCPFIAPLPFVWGFPAVLLGLGLCVFKYILRRSVTETAPLSSGFAIEGAVLIFFGWILLRYCMNPVAPGVAVGIGSGVTGFRAYLSYAVSLLLCCVLGVLCPNRSEIVRLIRWMGWLSLIFAVFFTPLIFTKSFALAEILSTLGVFVGVFDNGFLRFVVLSGFGSTLVILALLPALVPCKLKWRVLLFLIGIAAVVLGGNRSTLAMTICAIIAIGIAARRTRLVMVTIGSAGLLLLLAYVVGEYSRFDTSGVGVWRIAALVSNRAAEVSDATATVQWRKERWERAMQDVYAHPLMGVGYGGLENAFVFANEAEYETASVDIDVAAGTIHNGYIAGARALGIPALVLFVFVLARSIVRQAKCARLVAQTDHLQRDLHCFATANLAALTLGVFIGSDLNNPVLWFYIALGTILTRARQSTTQPRFFPLRQGSNRNSSFRIPATS